MDTPEYNEFNDYNWSAPQTRVMKCKQCGEDVNVNINYHIESVTCNKCWALTNKEMNNI